LRTKAAPAGSTNKAFDFARPSINSKLARNDLSQALGLGRNLKEPASRSEKSAKVLRDVVKSKDSPRLDTSAFAHFSAPQLAHETLIAAERLAPQIAAIMASDAKLTVDAQILSSLIDPIVREGSSKRRAQRSLWT
jgi:hypothetical protein